MSAVNEIEQYVKDQRQAKLLDVAKHVLSGMLAHDVYTSLTPSELASDSLRYAEELIKKVESR